MNALKVMEISRKLDAFLKSKAQIDKPLCDYTSLNIGGRAPLFITPENEIDRKEGV